MSKERHGRLVESPNSSVIWDRARELWEEQLGDKRSRHGVASIELESRCDVAIKIDLEGSLHSAVDRQDFICERWDKGSTDELD